MMLFEVGDILKPTVMFSLHLAGIDRFYVREVYQYTILLEGGGHKFHANLDEQKRYIKVGTI